MPGWGSQRHPEGLPPWTLPLSHSASVLQLGQACAHVSGGGGGHGGGGGPGHGGGGHGNVGARAEVGLFGLPQFRNGTNPTVAEAEGRLIYVAHNSRLVDAGNPQVLSVLVVVLGCSTRAVLG